MDVALFLAQHSLRENSKDLPTAAVVVHRDPQRKQPNFPAGSLISASANLKETLKDPTAHGELIALRRAAEALGSWRLSHCTLYSTLEPCVMCTGAMLQARLHAVVYGARSPKFGALGSLYNLSEDSRLNHHLEVRSGVREKEAAELLQRFFRMRRQENKDKVLSLTP